jgi:hypothetical protein
VRELDGASSPYVWLEYDGGVHCWGHPQRMAGARAARAPYVWFTQDDNIAAAAAFEHIALVTAAEQKPCFFRWLAPWRVEIWRTPQLAMGNIDADCLVFPRGIAQQARWGLRYEGDFDAAVEASVLAGGDVTWREEVISVARPDPHHRWWEKAS